jgi:hypothetical protein
LNACSLIIFDDDTCLMSGPLEKAGKRFGLSRSESLLKTELMAIAWQAHAALCGEIETSVLSNARDRTRIRTAHLDYLKAIKSLERFTSEVVSKQRAALLHERANWQSTPDADAVGFWIAAYEAFSSTLAKLPSLSELEHPPEELLSAFEELPDCP